MSNQLRSCGEMADLHALEAAQQQWQAGLISEQEYIDRAVAVFVREVGSLMTDEQCQDMASVLRFTCRTSPVMRTRLGLNPFEEEDRRRPKPQ